MRTRSFRRMSARFWAHPETHDQIVMLAVTGDDMFDMFICIHRCDDRHPLVAPEKISAQMKQGHRVSMGDHPGW